MTTVRLGEEGEIAALVGGEGSVEVLEELPNVFGGGYGGGGIVGSVGEANACAIRSVSPETRLMADDMQSIAMCLLSTYRWAGQRKAYWQRCSRSTRSARARWIRSRSGKGLIKTGVSKYQRHAWIPAFHVGERLKHRGRFAKRWGMNKPRNHQEPFEKAAVNVPCSWNNPIL